MSRVRIHSVHRDILTAATIAVINTLRILSTTLSIILSNSLQHLVYFVLYHHRTVDFYVHLYL